ncbi:MAG: flagellar protein FliO/FliZ [Paraglaciecola sp.]|jgi:flagellar protein FliO/FliZ
MLLANWKESKSLSKKNNIKSMAWISTSLFVLSSFGAQAESKTLSNPTSIVSIFLSLLLVIAVVLMLAYLMRRFNVTSSGSSQLKIIASLAAGTRERVLVIEVGNEQHVIGITSHNINHLAKLEIPLSTDKNVSGDNFKDKLGLFMAGKMPHKDQSRTIDQQMKPHE